jgi:rhodanese-related sulfurtransferase
MEHINYIIIAAIIIFFILKKMGQVSAQKAIELVNQGAVVIDVRTPSEFAGGSVKEAVNLPLDSISQKISVVVPDKEQPIMVFCLSGTRSAMARRVLRSNGYKNVYNLGSLWRAKTILA